MKSRHQNNLSTIINEEARSTIAITTNSSNSKHNTEKITPTYVNVS